MCFRYTGENKIIKQIKRFVLLLGFMTRIPVPFSLKINPEEWGKSLLFAPLVGIVIGGILSGAFYLLEFVFPSSVNVVLILVFYILITGGLHLDGLGDTFDGLFSNRPKEEILKIMHDSRLGTNALLAVISVLFLDLTFLYEIQKKGEILRTLLLMPAAGRMGILAVGGLYSYAKNQDGFAKLFIEHCKTNEFILGFIFYFIACLIVYGKPAVILSISTTIIPLGIAYLMSRKIDGVTGDILGCICELNQVVFLTSVYLF